MNRYEALKHAVKAHAGQVDKCGQPYILHPLAVAEVLEATEQVPQEPAVIVALLHDVLEDTDHELRAQDFHDFEWDALYLLTQQLDQTYAEYIDQICEAIIQLRPGQAVSVHAYDRSRLAAFVKLADLWHNLHPERAASLPSQERMRLRERYLGARERIWEALGHEWWPGEEKA